VVASCPNYRNSSAVNWTPAPCSIFASAYMPKAHWSASITSPGRMNSTSTQFVTSGRMGIYDPMHQIGMWGENFESNRNTSTSTMFIAGNPNPSASIIIAPDTKLDNQVKIVGSSSSVLVFGYAFRFTSWNIFVIYLSLVRGYFTRYTWTF